MTAALRVLAVLLLAASLAACGAAATPSPAGTDVTITATEFAYEPSSVEAPAGSTITFTLENKGSVEHDITIDALNFQLYAAVGETPSLSTPALAAGSYEFHCSIPGHKEAGMTGTITVK